MYINDYCLLTYIGGIGFDTEVSIMRINAEAWKVTDFSWSEGYLNGSYLSAACSHSDEGYCWCGKLLGEQGCHFYLGSV